MKKYDFIKLVCVVSWAVSLAACKTPSPPPSHVAPPPPPVSEPVSRAETIDTDQERKHATAVERIFTEGLELYEQGDYAAAIKKFQAPELSRAWPELRIRTLKYLAFSYCVTNNLQSCQNAFHDALKINPKFRLLPSEEKHPIWGPVFQQVQSEFQEQARQPEPPASSQAASAPLPAK